MRPEVVLGFPVEKARVPLATYARGLILCSSLKSLRAHGHIDRYYAHLDPAWRTEIDTLTVSQWAPINMAIAHYHACDALDLARAEEIAIGKEVGALGHGSFASTAGKLVAGVGFTPWTILGQADKFWARAFRGSAVAVFRLGPKDARVEMAGWPCARFRYCRVSVGGIIESLLDPVCTSFFVRPLADLCTDLTLGYRLQWS